MVSTPKSNKQKSKLLNIENACRFGWYLTWGYFNTPGW